MAKILDATCDATGIVRSQGVPVPAAEILSAGDESSEGLLFLEGDKARYLASSAKNIEDEIQDTIDALDAIGPALTEIANALTAIGANMTGPTTAPPPTLAASVTVIQSKVTLIETAKTSLTTLKGKLI